MNQELQEILINKKYYKNINNQTKLHIVIVAIQYTKNIAIRIMKYVDRNF